MGNHFFKSLEINNFRGIKESEISEFARINLFVGKNNCGKTTVLESLFLLVGISNPDLMINIQNLRGIALTEPGDIKDFFFEQKDREDLHLAGVQEVAKRELTVTPYYENSYVNQAGRQIDIPINGSEEKHVPRTKAVESQVDKNLSGLEYKFSVSTGKKSRPRKYNSKTTAEWSNNARPARFQVDIDKKYRERLQGRFVTQKGSNIYEPLLVDRMLEEKRKDVLLEALQFVEPKIQDIKVGPTRIVSADVGCTKFLPINLLGDGLLNVLNIISTVDFTSRGILMIDEIGAGLHVSCIKHLWKILIEQSRKRDTQIFITTHSKDVIEGLVEFYKQENLLFSEDENAVACFYLNKNGSDQVKGYRYSPEQLGQVLESDTDIRH